ncbi:MAG TPA: hypothetical protein GXX54_08675 [Clostridiales bacterium]|nr:hypothetical protein [Clostridiales bacterium]
MMITFVLILTVLYSVGFCSLVAVFSCFAVLKLNEQNFKNKGLKKESKPVLSDEQARELKRRQRELFNFLNFNGDVMPDVDDEEAG